MEPGATAAYWKKRRSPDKEANESENVKVEIDNSKEAASLRKWAHKKKEQIIAKHGEQFFYDNFITYLKGCNLYITESSTGSELFLSLFIKDFIAARGDVNRAISLGKL